MNTAELAGRIKDLAAQVYTGRPLIVPTFSAAELDHASKQFLHEGGAPKMSPNYIQMLDNDPELNLLVQTYSGIVELADDQVTFAAAAVKAAFAAGLEIGLQIAANQLTEGSCSCVKHRVRCCAQCCQGQ